MRQLNNVITFLEVARCRSFAEAARALGLSTSATSKGVARLEEELGVKLLHRTTRSVSLTAEGERFYEGASRLTGEMDELVTEVSESNSAPRGRITVGCTVVLGRIWLAERLVAFQRDYPEVSVELVLDDRAVDMAAEGIDVALRAGALGDNANLVARHFFDIGLAICASPEYLAAHGTPDSVEALDGHNCLNFRNPTHGRLHPWRFTLDGYSVSQVMKGNMVANAIDAIKLAAVSGVGIAQLPSYMVGEDMMSGRLVPVLPHCWPAPQPYHILYLDRRRVSPRIRALIDFLVADAPDFQRSLPCNNGR